MEKSGQKSLILGIIGGDGRMGSLLRRVFEKHVGQVLISSLNTTLSNVELTQRADVILISVPIENFDRVIEEISPYVTERQLLLDVTSLKEAPCKKMLMTKASVIGMHPMFAPSLLSLEGEKIILCPVREGNWKAWVHEIWSAEKARLFEMQPEIHDRWMAVIQALTHFTNLIFSDVISSSNLKPQELLAFSSPVFQMQLYLAIRVLSQSAEMYADIQMKNPYFVEILKQFANSFSHLKDIVCSRDKKAFLEFFSHCAYHYKELEEEALTRTGEFIQTIRKEDLSP